MSSFQDPSDILPELLQTAFETLDDCHAALMQIQTPGDFLAQSEALWHQRERAIRQIGAFLAPENLLSERLKLILMSRLEAFQKEDACLQQHIHQFKTTLQQQRLANTAQLKAMQHYGRSTGGSCPAPTRELLKNFCVGEAHEPPVKGINNS